MKGPACHYGGTAESALARPLPNAEPLRLP
jgi:hypothetical protein